MGKVSFTSPTSADATPAEEQKLIPERTIISNLLEGLRLEQSSTQTLLLGETPWTGRCNSDELTGFFFLSGEVSFSFKDAPPIQARKMDYLLIGRNAPYSIRAISRGSSSSIVKTSFKLDNSVGHLLFRLLPAVIYIDAMSSDEGDWHTKLGELIADHPECSRAAAAAINHRLVEASLISLVQSWLFRNPPHGLQFDSPETTRIYPSLQAMHDAPDRAWTVPSLARIAGMSTTLFVNKFKNVTGDTPVRYLTTIRLDKAKELLTLTQLSLNDIAQRTGYSTDIALIRAFRRGFGMPPGQFRKEGYITEQKS